MVVPNGLPNPYPGQISDCLLLSNGVETQRPGRAVQITVSVAGTVTLTLLSGATIDVTVPVGCTIYPYEVIKATTGTATVTSVYNIYG